ncbi:MAG: hypothetical protein DWQ05_20610 [Calditrichaeota bacterium]|nr:MAG: hypothetical protein DWQ05_20610 [Calditrichota bacterium]
MDLLKNKIVLGCLTLFGLFHLFEFLFFKTIFLSSYLDDFLCLPLLLAGILYVQQRFVFKEQTYYLPIKQVIFSVLFIALVFEGILPWISQNHTRDLFDIIAYAGGAVLFHFFINRRVNSDCAR